MRALKNRIKQLFIKINMLKVRYRESRKKKYSLDEDYNHWIEQFDLLTDSDIALLHAELAQRAKASMLITAVIGLNELSNDDLLRTIASLEGQIYPYWKLLVIHDSGLDGTQIKQLQKIKRKSSNVQLLMIPGNLSTVSLWNAAISSDCESEYFIFLDSGDQLAKTALYYIAKTAQEEGLPELIYTDEDEIDSHGLRLNHFFKPDLNEVMMLAFNVIGRAVAYKKSALEQLSGFGIDQPEIALYDTNLKIIEKHLRNGVTHIPRLLFHKKQATNPTLEDVQFCELQKKIVSEHLERSHLKGGVEVIQNNPCLTRVMLTLPDVQPLVSILIPMRDKVALTRQCIDSIRNKSTYQHYEIIIIDNDSVEPESLEYLNSIQSDCIRVLHDDSPFNFAALNNRAAEIARGQILCLLNNDIEVLTPNWLEEMFSFTLQPKVGCVGAKLWYPDGRLQHGGVIWGIGDVAGHAHKYSEKGYAGYHHRLMVHQSILAVTGACLMVRKEIWDQVGGLNEQLAVAFNDVDFCLKVWNAGYKNIWTPYVEMVHHESVSRGPDEGRASDYQKEKLYVNLLWNHLIGVDIFYNPNLTLEYENFHVKLLK